MSKSLETLREIGGEVIKVTCLAGWVEETTKEAYGKRFDEIEKELKALEIIKAKKVETYHLSRCKTLIEYNSAWDIGGMDLTQDEFDLLKEVLE